ncbi:MAG: GNAT family N-acetyltransferase [Actinomycetota bacterium]
MRSREMHVLSFPEAAVPRDLRLQVLALQDQAWPEDEAQDRWGELQPSHDPASRPVSMLLVQDDRVLAALDILSKEITHGGERYTASGLSTVVTDPAERRKGYGRHLVLAARDAIGDAGADLGIFTCDRPLQAFYEGAGWQTLEDTVLIGGTRDAPFPSDRFDKVTMAAFFSPKAKEYAATFARSRVELYPGEIDRLW